MNETYFWIASHCPTADFELISWQLFEEGAPTVEELENSNSETTYFKISSDDKELLNHIHGSFPDFYWTSGEEENQDWNLWWKSQQEAIVVSENLRVLPPWVEAEAKEGVIDLVIEAKMAFGTGSHESTRLCAQLMQNVLPSQEYTLLDVGTGTGILAMYAEKISPAQIFTTEIDPVTSPCLIENFAQNGLNPPKGILGGLECFKQDAFFDVLICNMIRSEIWPLRTEMIRLLKNQGIIILSGQLAAEDYYVKDWFKENNIEIVSEKVDGEWWAVAGKISK
jgi:ribosomal protein L11 methyltransferase